MEYSEEFLKECSEKDIRITLNPQQKYIERISSIGDALPYLKMVKKERDKWGDLVVQFIKTKQLPYEASIALHDILEALEERKVK